MYWDCISYCLSRIVKDLIAGICLLTCRFYTRVFVSRFHFSLSPCPPLCLSAYRLQHQRNTQHCVHAAYRGRLSCSQSVSQMKVSQIQRNSDTSRHINIWQWSCYFIWIQITSNHRNRSVINTVLTSSKQKLSKKVANDYTNTSCWNTRQLSNSFERNHRAIYAESS